MDDEILGCGGTLCKHVQAGASVTTVYMTDGRKGSNPTIYDQGWTNAALAEIETVLVAQRKEEAKRAGLIVGIQQQIFLDAPDGNLVASPATVSKVHGILRHERPEVIYLPSRFDLHCDHRATYHIAYAAAQESPSGLGFAPIYREYEVWTPVIANRVIDISDVIETKNKAIEAFKSQVSHTNYLRTQLALNAYRSLYYSQGCGFAEAFFESTSEEFSSLHQHTFHESI
jgi:LmbE family N-acetylglucosaminyl deacetylase